ncbi:MAG: Z1 domain-containing protein [Gammaproteobacteria bacterium]|nr:Z1 domain-containing protein [Gammaproteobacteria bacterium]
MAHYAYDDVKSLIMRTLRQKETVTSDIIIKEVNILLEALKAANLVDEIDSDMLFRDISSQISVWQPDPSVLRDKKHFNWLPERKSEIGWGFWKRYRQYLEDEKNWSSNVTAKLDSITDSILGDIGNPAQTNSWDRRGMVVGDVQSGKTSNYTGLICKAVDAGYKLVLVLAGMTNDLRSQTQSRLDAEFLGFESELGKLHDNSSRIGVGKLADHGQLIVQPLTYSAKDGDFRAKTGANLQLGGNPLILVVKKNVSVLKRVLKWVESQGITNPDTGEKVVKGLPILLLDDEADNASVNTKTEDEDPTAINRAIRKILKIFSQSSYVGYTATPFANIFILPDEDDPSEYGPDLFPKNFIYYISPPDNYVGAAQIFGLSEDVDGIDSIDRSFPLIRRAEDSEVVFPPRHKKEQLVDHLPDSMIEALQAFVLTCAARRVRGQKNVHNSMLIHVTRFNLVQEQIQELVSVEIIKMQRMLEYQTGKQASKFIFQLQTMWEADFSPTSKTVRERTDDQTLTNIKWEEVYNELLEAVLKIQVRGINGYAGGVLDYADNSKGLNVIAIGGDKLSRGLTLEGLTVSYYTRPAKNYDTLLQMGRWFGYRPGYVDLCRLYTTEELVAWYQHISVASEELKREFRLMELSNLTPEDYGLKVRTHPNELNITASNKIRHGKRMLVTFSGHLAQTTVFQKDKAQEESNFNHTEGWLKRLGAPDNLKKNNLIWENIDPGTIKQFLKGYRTHPLSRKAETDLLIKYIEKLNERGELTNWTAVVISNSTPERKHEISGYDVGLVQRTDDTPESDLYMLKNANIISPADQYLDLTKEQESEAMRRTIEAWKEGKTRSKKQPKTPSGPFIRSIRPPENGLLLIYPLNPDIIQYKQEKVTDLPIIGFAISFPKGSRDEVIEYQVNTRYWQDRYAEDEDDI